ncbi:MULTISPECIES: response regulator [unclassified Paenibacillus]|uniref:response regulator transcription factor n=1 Tax=unclassified Paenibacillus TaxID=185978 RepID=UPI00095622C2|nr:MULTISPECIES: response regulator [unclassified Paenibacillus]ASS67141.1 response regulator [Paenibacillus sp. RUD330]SIQ88626.1 two-component system, response regulator YesN [Paenibacillus sp. RU4X]SIR09576.1 two-component system, response regulator YesN [Paenibacillus sp. RU4T]
MYSLLIVDDEPAIREGMQTLIEWERLGFRVAGLAADGLEGLRLYRELAPDLILVDIRMPRMNGLELVEEIRRRDSACRIMVLSGHADFSYAQQAIRYGIEGYLLKPVDEDELEQYAARIARSLDEERGKAADPAKRREEALLALLAGDAEGALSIAADAGRAGMLPGAQGEAGGRDASGAELWRLLHGGAPGGRVLLAEAGLADGQEQAEFRRRLEAGAAARGLGPVFEAGASLGLLIPSGESALRSAAKLLEESAGEGGFTAAAGRCAEEPPAAARSLLEAQELMALRFLLEPGRIHTERPAMVAAETSGDAASSAARAADGRDDARLAELALALSRAVETGGMSGIVASLDEAAASLAAGNASRPAFSSAMAELMTLVMAELGRHGGAPADGRHGALAASVYRHAKWSSMREELAAGLSAVQQSLDASDSGSVLRRMTGFIERHYGEPLRLETLAELFGYNSGYLGKLFKSHTGVSFNAYLDRLRIERAIAMLEGGMKVRQAAEKVGYANVDYFHAKFKKYTGKSPSFYKKPSES